MHKLFILIVALMMVCITSLPAVASGVDQQVDKDIPAEYSWASRTVIWKDASVGYSVAWTGTLQTQVCVAANTPCRIWLLRTIDGGDTWTYHIEIGLIAFNTNAPYIAGPSLWWDKWTPGITTENIHIAWVDRNFQTIQTKYRRFNVGCDCFTIASTAVGTSSTAATAVNGETTQVSVTRSEAGTLYVASAFPTTQTRFFSSIDLGVSWVVKAASSTCGLGLAPIVYSPSSDGIYSIRRNTTDRTQAHICKYTLSGDSWTVLGASPYTVNSWSNWQFQGTPSDIVVCNGRAFVVTAGNEGTANGRLHLEFFSINTDDSITVIGDMFTVSTNRFYSRPGRLFCDEQTHTLYVAYSWKPLATDATNFASNTTYPSAIYYNKRIAPFGAWSTQFTVDVGGHNPNDGFTDIYPPLLGYGRMANQTGHYSIMWHTGEPSSVFHRWISDIATLTLSSEVIADDDSLADKIRQMLGNIGLVDANGYLLFAIGTTLALGVILLAVHTPFVIVGISCAIWVVGIILSLASGFGGIMFSILLLAIFAIVVVIFLKLKSGKSDE